MELKNSIITNYIQMENIKTIEINKLLVMFIIAMGEWNGVQWEYFPKLPSCFVENLNIKPLECKADFLRLTVNDLCDVECWFIDKDEQIFCMPLRDMIKYAPLLYTSIVTHVFDMIENVKEC